MIPQELKDRLAQLKEDFKSSGINFVATAAKYGEANSGQGDFTTVCSFGSVPEAGVDFHHSAKDLVRDVVINMDEAMNGGSKWMHHMALECAKWHNNNHRDSRLVWNIAETKWVFETDEHDEPTLDQIAPIQPGTIAD